MPLERGFGRTGSMWGSQSMDVQPDMLTCAKALSSAYLPISAVIMSNRVYDMLASQAEELGIFGHGYTYSAHPAACAAGIATQKIYETEGLFENAAALEPYFLDAIFSLQDHPMVADVRGIGMMGGIEVHPEGGAGKRGGELQKKMFWNGLHVKWTGDNGIIAPAFVAERKHIDEIVDKLMF